MTSITSVPKEIKSGLSLSYYPNPLSDFINVSYSVSKPEIISLSINNYMGIEVARLVNNKMQPASQYNIEFNISNLPSGVYFCTLKAGNQVKTVKMIVLR